MRERSPRRVLRRITGVLIVLGVVAMFGYWYIPGQASAISFFPLYPSLMRLGHWMGADPLLAGVLITLICGAAAAVLLYRWTARVFSPRVAAIAVAFFLLYPYSYYL